jgi:hypothetical protein
VTAARGSDRAGDRPALLVTVRHPGPAECVAAALPSLAAGFDVVVLAGELERARMERELRGPGIRHIPAAAPADVLEQLDATLVAVAPSACLRTTPAGGCGPDELLGTALARRADTVPVVAVQDDYGVGDRLDEADAIATVDRAAVDLLDAPLRKRATPIGRLPHDSFVTGASPAEARRSGRRRLGLDSEPVVLHLTGAGPAEVEAADVRAVLAAAPRAREPAVTLVRPHPRLDDESRAACRRLVEEAGAGRALWADEPGADRSWLVVADAILSARSTMNVDSLAFQSAFGGPDRAALCNTASVYYRGAVFAAGAGAAGAAPLELRTRGSFVADPDDLEEVLDAALHDRDERARRAEAARAWLRPDGLAAERLVGLVRQITASSAAEARR